MPAPEEKKPGHALSRAPAVDSADQNATRTPKRNCRSSSLALVITRKFPLLREPVGFRKCGVLNKLAASARSCSSSRSVNLNVRNRLKSRFTEPGPYSVLRPTVPYGLGPEPGRVTATKAEGS